MGKNDLTIKQHVPAGKWALVPNPGELLRMWLRLIAREVRCWGSKHWVGKWALVPNPGESQFEAIHCMRLWLVAREASLQEHAPDGKWAQAPNPVNLTLELLHAAVACTLRVPERRCCTSANPFALTHSAHCQCLTLTHSAALPMRAVVELSRKGVLGSEGKLQASYDCLE